MRDGASACASTVPVIMVAGTNGKGSDLCDASRAIARQAGYRVGLYHQARIWCTSTERCRINGAPVADAVDLLPHFAAVEAARGEHRR